LLKAGRTAVVVDENRGRLARRAADGRAGRSRRLCLDGRYLRRRDLEELRGPGALLDRLLSLGLDRGDMVIAFGGGVVGESRRLRGRRL